MPHSRVPLVIVPLAIPDVVVLKPTRIQDDRGWFLESLNLREVKDLGFDAVAQENESCSVYSGTVRGLHYQRAPFAQAKIVRCLQGALLDVAVDIRPASPTFGRHVVTRLDAVMNEQVLIPAGFAHGFCTLAPQTIINYKVSAPYAPLFDGGIAWDDPSLGIDWPVPAERAILSDRDHTHPRLADAVLD